MCRTHGVISFYAYICQRKTEDDIKGITIGPTGGHGLSRMQGTKVTLAGRTAFLPNDDVPFVFQRLTAGQINAIPRDRFSVALIEVPTRMGMAGPGKKGRGGMAVKGLQRMKDLSRTGGGITGFVRKPSSVIKVEEDGTKQYTAMITLAKQVIQTADDMYSVNRRLSRNSGGGPPSESDTKGAGTFVSDLFPKDKNRETEVSQRGFRFFLLAVGTGTWAVPQEPVPKTFKSRSPRLSGAGPHDFQKRLPGAHTTLGSFAFPEI